MMGALKFSGHESFHCRHFWLKKGFDYVEQNKKFADNDATSVLGVGKNMVNSINFWLKAFEILDNEHQLTTLGNYIFGKEGKDPYLEDLGTLWLLQYHLIKNQSASIYHLMFKDFRKKHLHSQFSVDQVEHDIIRLLTRENQNVAVNTIRNDIKVFLRTYFIDTSKKKDLEDNLSSILVDLSLVNKLDDAFNNNETYQFNISEREEIPTEIFLYAILNSFDPEGNLEEDQSLSFDELQIEVADSFACSREGLEKHIFKIQEKYSWVVYKEDAARKEIQLKSNRLDKFQVLNKYYG